MEAQPRKVGRQLPPWQPLEVVQLGAASLRAGSLQWFDQKGHITSFGDLVRERCSCLPGSLQGVQHLECTKKWRFLGAEDGTMKVFQLGDHSLDVDKKATGPF